MLVLSKPYTDRHGITFTGAVLVVTAINYAVSNSGSFVLDRTGEIPDYNHINQNSSMNVGFTVALYASEAAFENKRDSMEFKSSTGQTYFNMTLPVNTDPETLVEKCEAHLAQEVGA